MLRWIHSGGAFQALSILFGAGMTIGAAIALGRACFGRSLKSWPERFVCGAALLQFTVFVLCCARAAYPLLFVIDAILIFWFWFKQGGRQPSTLHFSAAILFVAFAAYFLLYFFNAMAPEVSPDGATYHLGLVSLYMREHGFHPITWDFYASFPEGIEMLFLFAFAFGRHSAAALVHFAFLAALAWQMMVYAQRRGFAQLGACAALLVFASPVVGKDAISAYNDAALACVAFTLFTLLEEWDETRNPGLLLPIGLVAGFAFAVKYTGGVALLYAAGFLVWRGKWKGREAARLFMPAAAAALMVAPWIVKNWLWVQNPVSPFFNSWFPNAYVTVWFEKDYMQYLRLYELRSRWQIPLAATVRGDLAGIVGPVFLLAPLALLSLRRSEGRRLLLGAAVFGATYFSNIGARFLIPPLPFVAMALMLGIANQSFAVAIALLHAVLSWPAVVARYALPGAWILHDAPWKYAFRLRPESEYLKAHLPQYSLDRLIDSATEPNATVLEFGAIPEAYTSRKLLVEYESADNHYAALTLEAAFLGGSSPAWRAGFSFPRQELRGFRLVQTASGPEQWKIHELRAFDGAAELSRSGWRATAKPFPWGIERALDGNLITFWISGDPLRAGASVEVQFAAPAMADAVLMETSPNQPHLKLQLFGEPAAGAPGWKLLSADADISATAKPDLRRAAVEELKRRGIGYVLLFESDELAKPVRESGAAAGITPVGQASGGTLYRLQ